MPALPAVAGGLRVTFDWSASGDTHAITKHYFHFTGTAPDASGLADISTAVVTAWGTNLKPLMSSEQELLSVITADISSSMGLQDETSVVTNGTRSGSALQAQVCALLNHKIARHYRGGKPRSYFPWGTSTDLLAPNEWQSSFVTAVNSGWAAFLAALVGVTFDSTTIDEFVNVSYYSGYGPSRTRSNGHLYYPPAVRATPVVDTISSSTLNPLIATQKRRVQRGS